MAIFARRRPEVKTWPVRVAPKPLAPFAAGLDHAPVPPPPDVPPMPRRRVRWTALDLAPLPEERLEPEPEMSLSGAWRVPGEDSWDFGHAP